MRDFQELHVWQRAHALTLRIYEETRAFPPDERFGVTSQLRRCAASVAANIAEGCGRSSDNELARFLTIALGSLAETSYFLILVRDLEYLLPDTAAHLQNDLTKLRKMLIAFHRRLKPLSS
ncbi:four helix bundle protein [Deinococcus koreensis]|uniref:Diversity-generating retroelement protein bAvd family protein n=1 Tax=Deinococcus koreensis TaxID=2054903 RepID=A0A2K3UZK0_9DEIO|nr:four helix bundle protein [Deinococcus koreensis]PNY81953.1 diversity-generating retroelement protein bAvd family protein [Deinococcus koreensis]